MEILIEVIFPGILGANHLRHRHCGLSPCLFKCERPVEGVGILHHYDRGRQQSQFEAVGQGADEERQ